MNHNFMHSACLLVALPLWLAAAGQTAPSQQSAPAPVPYASVSQLNVVLSQVEQVSQSAQLDLAKLRVEKWKTDSNTKRQSEANVESLTRNMHSALPELIAQLRAAPEDLNITFKLYRNLEALYDVLGSVVESAGAFGSKDEFQALANDLSSMDRARRSLADRIDGQTASQQAELNRLRAELKNAQAAIPATPPKKVIVDDTEPPKKPAKTSKKKSSTPKTTPPQTTPTPPQ